MSASDHTEYSGESSGSQFDFVSIQGVLINQLRRLYQESPDLASKNIHVLPAVNDGIEGQLEQQLRQEREDHTEKRIVLIPYCLEHSHWIGILIEFEGTDQILRAEYIDPVSGDTVVPSKIRQKLSKIYPTAVLKSKDRYKHSDRRFSSALTVKNLLVAVRNDQTSMHHNLEADSGNTRVPNTHTVVSQTASAFDIQTSVPSGMVVQKKGNEHILAKKQQELNSGLGKYKVRSIDALPQKIQKTEERIREYEEEERTGDANKEKMYLNELQQLQNLANEIATITQQSSTIDEGLQLKVCQMRKELEDGLARLKIQNEAALPQKVEKTKERIQEYEDEDRKEDAQRERVYLEDLQRLQNLIDAIADLNSKLSILTNASQLKIHQIEEELRNGFAKFKIQDEAILSQKIQKTETRIKEYEDEERAEDAERERSILRELQQLQNLLNEKADLTQQRLTPADIVQAELRQMKEDLDNGLTKFKIREPQMLSQKIQRTQDRIRDFQEEERMEDVEKEKLLLNEFQRLQMIADKIAKLDPASIVPPSVPSLVIPVPTINVPMTPEPDSNNTISLIDERKKRLYVNDLDAEASKMPDCARKTIIELLVYFERKVLHEDVVAQSQEALILSLQKLREQVKREELCSDDIRSALHNLETHLTIDNHSAVVRYANELLKRFRLLNVSEIQRLVAKATEAAELIQDKDVVLLIGTTGSGKSTTIQFLAGAKMKEVRVEVSPGRFLEHITAVGPINNPDLKNVISSPLQKSETRYIAPVTVRLKDVLGPQDSGIITLCDAPGFGDTGGPEVDIANSIGVIEALKGARSVKLLALLSLKDLGSRGQGVQKLAYILISMVRDIEDKLDAIIYAFTKFSPATDINALLQDIKKRKEEEDPTLQSDTVFINVLDNMIEKTMDVDDVIKVEPEKNEPKKLLRKLKNLRGIKNPAEIFRFSMSEETRATISEHVQRDKFSIICAMKHKDYDLIRYYLDDLQILKDLLKESFIRDIYEESIRFVSESINTYCEETKEKFNRVLVSQDGLQSKDILDYRIAINNLEYAQILKEHLGSALVLPASMIQNIANTLREISRNLTGEESHSALVSDTSTREELHSPLVAVYLRNLSELKGVFSDLQEYYSSSCKMFQKRFDELVQNAREIIPNHNFKEIADVFLNVCQSARVLQNHLDKKSQNVYIDIVKYLLQYLVGFSDRAEPLLVRVRLSRDEIETIKSYVEILRTAKDTAALQERVSLYMEMLKKKGENSEKRDSFERNPKDLNGVYDEFIDKILTHFNDIDARIKELFEKSGDHALENIKSLVNDMDALRTIPEIELKTAGVYYRTVENIRGYTEQLKSDAEKLIDAIEKQTDITNYKYLARSLARLKNAAWINEVSPGTYDNLMQRIIEELSQYAIQLEDNLMKIDLSLKCPDNVPVAVKIVEKIESMRDLEHSVPELEKYRKKIVERFEQCTQAVFDRIQKTFDLEDKDVYQIKQKLRDLEEIKRQYESLHPARILLRNHGYADVDTLNNDITQVEAKLNSVRQVHQALESEKETKMTELNGIIREFLNFPHTQTSVIDKLSTMIGAGSDKNAQANAYLQKWGYSRIENVYDQISKLERNHRNDLQRLQDQNTELLVNLHGLESIKKEHELLLNSSHTSPEETTFLREKGFSAYELLEEAIQQKTKVIDERGKSKQIFHFADRLDALTANSAIVYIIQCEKIGHGRVRENATDAHEKLRKYIQEYGIFLGKEINEKFIHTRNVDSEGGPFMYTQDLETRLQELLSFNRYPHVYESINGIEMVEKWQKEFLDFHRNLSGKMEEYDAAGKLRELRDPLTIAQALTCVDRFCANIFAGNGFGALHRQYNGKLNKEWRDAYRIVLEHISKGDYAKADMAIADIEDNPLNPKDKAQIQNDLECSLNKLMKDTKSVAFWLDGKIERVDNRSQIIHIKENIDKIRIACSKRSIMTLLDEPTQNNLRAFDNEISDILAGIILRGLNSIEAFMKADSFSEAEHGMETISQVQRELVGYCTSEDVMTKGETLRKKLDGIVDEVLARNEFSDINQFSINPPKDLLDRLKAVAGHGSAKFMEAHTSMLTKTRKTFSVAIEEARKAPLSERSVQIRSLNYALCFLPEQLQEQFRIQITELSKLITDEEKKYREDLENCLTSVDDNEHTIAQAATLARRYNEQNMHDFLRMLRDKCLKKLQMYQTHAQKSFEEQNIGSAIEIVKKLLRYEAHLGSYIPEIKGILENLCVLAIKKSLSCCETVGNIASIEQTTIVEKAFTDIVIYLEFSNASEKEVEAFFPADFTEKARESFHSLSEYFVDNSESFQVALKDKNILELYKTISISKKWQPFIEKIRRCSLNHTLVHNLLREMKNVSSYKDMISELELVIDTLKSQLNVDFISDDTTRYEGKRDDLFSNLNHALNMLKSINMKLKDLLSSPIDIDTCEEEIKAKVENMKTQLMTIAAKSELTITDTDEFRMYYNHLVSFDKCCHLPSINIRPILTDAQEKIFAKVELLKQTAEKSIGNPAAVSVTIVKIKFLAENLAMFDRQINDEIDELLKRYKLKLGSAGITSLSAELEKTDVGARLISEHSTLIGEDWRIRREKMQKQDDLDYVLVSLTGTDLGEDILRARYETFKKKYNELLSTYLKTITGDNKKESDLDTLIAETKSLTKTVTIAENSVIWSRAFKEDLPILVAHISAIWTLKNTQHYNEMRGIDQSNAYLLMPHVGQVIAIFRLLGLGYKRYTEVRGHKVIFTGKISEDLVNNLVELGTGEGKSVVLAITACVFALSGVDVNCSCYSDILSTRDKKEFALLFRALGIEDRIEYGTFNKLCEQLLNEQCNVREKVRDMIVTNKKVLGTSDGFEKILKKMLTKKLSGAEKIDSTTTADKKTVATDDTSAQVSLKVLLIDEVDVFLSDKYYGGMYIPSVFLKDETIKALLDSIWKNKHLKSLNSVKLLPAYEACATKFSNWMFLFDEAIKDMIAALQSYQSSTYLVQNDKIVYVFGESVVDNIVLGYDTVWAYYHENDKGCISAASLTENVGILINCGRFSYAEMPHDFAYIGGVTGTLSTLAPIETQILSRVYSITNTTYIPSVFGSSNRLFNQRNDVRVVKENEYFMEICGEIRTVCNASRAILVFFESEEKLETFHKSAQLAEMKQDVQIITEKVSVKDRELYVKRAATVGKVTLLTRTFGRGTDFICRNQQLLANGGIHVLQTFFSEELSEEYQIMGRGARQGDKGSYRMILLDKDLEWVLGPSWREDVPKIQGTILYSTLHKARNILYESKCGAKELGIEQCKSDHQASKKFMSALVSADMAVVRDFLMKQNRGATLATASSRTILLMDATASMSNLLSAAKDTVCTMYERASIVLKDKEIPNDAFQMQCVVYRDYDCREEGLLQSSAWETKPDNLRNFMTKVSAKGGGDYEEAIEIGLWHAVQESENHLEGISQVILIGDAPAKDEKAIKRDRKATGGDAYWSKTKYAVPTHFTTEIQKLQSKKIPVYAFYLDDGAKVNFDRIAEETSGRSQYLDIRSSQGAELLTKFVTEEVLRKTAGDQGDIVVNRYRELYPTFTA